MRPNVLLFIGGIGSDSVIHCLKYYKYAIIGVGSNSKVNYLIVDENQGFRIWASRWIRFNKQISL